MLFSERAEFAKRGGGLARVDGFGADGYAFFQVAGQTCSYERGGGIEQHDVAAGAAECR